MEILMGMKVVVSPYIKPVPVLQIAHDFIWCSDEFRAKYNAWLLERFGTFEPTYMIGRDTIAMSPRTSAMLQNQVPNI